MVVEVSVAEKHAATRPLSFALHDAFEFELHRQTSIAAGKASFVAPHKGAYRLCLTNAEKTYLHTFILVRSGPQAKDYSSLLSTEDVKPVERSLQRIKDTAGHMLKEVKALAKVEEALRKSTHSVYNRVIGTGLVTLAVIGGIGLIQVYVLKTELKRKKVL